MKIKNKNKYNQNIIVTILFIILSFCYLIFFINNKGETIIKADIDGQFHFSRIMSLANIWNSPVNFNYFNHTGEIVNLMYPWAMVYPMYLLIKLTHSLVSGYYLYFLLLTFITLEITYYCVKKMHQSTLGAIMAAILYAFAMCRTSGIYFRMAVGMAVGMTFLPLVLLGIYQIFYEDISYWKMLVLGMSLLLYSHLLSVVMAAIMIIFFMVVNLIRKNFNKNQLKALIKATLMTLLLGIGFLIPMLQVVFNTKLSMPEIYDLYQSALTPQKLLESSLINQASSDNFYNVVFLILVVILIFNIKHLTLFFKDCLVGSAIFTFLSTTLFPWSIFQKIFTMIQFPWRFITIGTLLLAITSSNIVSYYQQHHSYNQTLKVVIILLMGIIIAHWGTMNNISNINDEHAGFTSSFYKKAIMNGANFNGLDDYAPKTAKKDLDIINANYICVDAVWYLTTPQYNANHVSYSYNASKKGKGILAVFNYDGEKVTNNQKEVKITAADDGATAVKIEKGVNYFEVSYHYTLLARIAWVISIMSALIFNIKLLKRKEKGK